ncbi:MAG: selenide, water dikinase SelD, partial [Dehalococcoidia bacterium]
PADLLVGLAQPDDAAVYKLSDERALIMTVDFFAPVVDDPYDYGAISAANAMSDVYAMGGEVAMALNISGFPVEMDHGIIAAIYRGGAEKVAEGGGVIVGGHTIIDAEPKYGLCVMGFVHPDRILTKAGARPGDVLYLTKPLGTGLITTAAKFQEVQADHLETAIACMSQLNCAAGAIVRDVGVGALTDVTGFGLLGHSDEMATAGSVGLRLEASALPMLPGAMDYAYRGIISGGGLRNRKHLDGEVRIADAVSEDFRHVLYDPQTSGGLLFALPSARADALEERFAQADIALWRVGEVVEGHGVTVLP